MWCAGYISRFSPGAWSAMCVFVPCSNNCWTSSDRDQCSACRNQFDCNWIQHIGGKGKVDADYGYSRQYWRIPLEHRGVDPLHWAARVLLRQWHYQSRQEVCNSSHFPQLLHVQLDLQLGSCKQAVRYEDIIKQVTSNFKSKLAQVLVM